MSCANVTKHISEIIELAGGTHTMQDDPNHFFKNISRQRQPIFKLLNMPVPANYDEKDDMFMGLNLYYNNIDRIKKHLEEKTKNSKK